MRIRFLRQRRERTASGSSLCLYIRRPGPTPPCAPGTPMALELDAAVLLERGQIALIVPLPSLFKLGLRPLSSQVLTDGDPLAPMHIWVVAPDEPIEIPADVCLARAVFLEAAPQQFYNDETLDDILDPHSVGPVIRTSRPDRGILDV